MKKITDEEYFKDERISQSHLKSILKSPAHFKSYAESKDEPSTAMFFGTAFHTAVLEPDEFSNRFIVTELSKRTNAYKDLAASTDKKLITPEDLEHIGNMVYKIKNHSEASEHLNTEYREVAFMTDLYKAKIDALNLNKKCIVDLKTTEDASMKEFIYSIKKWQYDFQAAFYLQMAEAELKIPLEYILIAIEKKPPYGVGIFELKGEAMVGGHNAVLIAKEMYEKCKREDSWPGYPDFKQVIDFRLR